MKEDFHIDLSNRFYDKKSTGIALVGAITKRNKGCGINGRTKRYIENNLFVLSIYEEYAKLYAICFYFLIKDEIKNVDKLIICNDEDFTATKKYILRLFELDNIELNFNIINITEYRKSLGRKIKSLADNYARSYAKRALKPTRWNSGKDINVVKIDYSMISRKWNLLR